MIYVADLGRWVNIRPDSELAGLFWAVQDARAHAIRRADIVLGWSIVSRTSQSDAHSYTYYFVSPKSAASQFGEELVVNDRVASFYDRRDQLLFNHNIHVSDWWNLDRFVVLEPDSNKLPVATPMDSIEHPVLAYEFSAKTGRLTPPARIRQFLQERRAATASVVDPIAFVEVDA